jgi:uncharacterized oxidoreductase
MNLTGNTILITGGTSGIGLGLAEALLELGNTVIITGRRIERLEQIRKKHPSIIIKGNDAADAGKREELCTWVVENHPDLNIFINNAGVQYAFDFTKHVPFNKVSNEIETNLTAHIHLAALFTQHLMNKKDAALINISSGLAFAPLAFMPVYCATKAAIHSFTMSLRYQLRNTSVKVFEIIPPSVDTELGHDRRADKTQTHGGIPISEFVAGAIEALKADKLEAAIGESKNLREKGEQAFSFMNK